MTRIHPDAAAAFVAYRELIANLSRLIDDTGRTLAAERRPDETEAECYYRVIPEERRAAIGRLGNAAEAARVEFVHLNTVRWMGEELRLGTLAPAGAA